MSKQCFEKCKFAINCATNVEEIKDIQRPTITDTRQQRFGEFLLTLVKDCSPEIVGSANHCLLNQITAESLVDAIQTEQ